MSGVYQDPELFLSGFAEVPDVPLALGPARFMRVPAAELSQLSFLDTSELHKPTELELSLAELVAQAVPAQQPFGIIYHSAFCCSTYLARCLEAVGIGRALKEPYALTQLAFYQADESWEQFASEDEWSKVLGSGLELLIRPQPGASFSLVKTHNFGIVLALDVAQLFPGRVRSVFVWSDLHSFLVSVLKSPERRSFVRMLLKFVSPGKAEMLEIPLVNPSGLDDASAAAYCWLLHMAYYRFAAKQLDKAQLCSLNCDVFLQDPSATLAALADFWERPVASGEIGLRLAGPGLGTHAKQPGKVFSAQQRRTDLETEGFRYRREVKQGTRWYESLDLADELRAEPGWPVRIQAGT